MAPMKNEDRKTIATLRADITKLRRVALAARPVLARCPMAWAERAALDLAFQDVDRPVTPAVPSLGCDLCGFGSVEDCDKFDPSKPCPKCGTSEMAVEYSDETGMRISNLITNKALIDAASRLESELAEAKADVDAYRARFGDL